MIVGQYLSALGILTTDEEAELHADMLRALVARGHGAWCSNHIRPPAPLHVRRLRAAADDLGVRLTVAPNVSAEAWFPAARPELVVSCFSTALLTADHYFGRPSRPWDVTRWNGSRPMRTATASRRRSSTPSCRSWAPTDANSTRPVENGRLVRAVGYCMQSDVIPTWRRARALPPLPRRGRYFKRRRLEAVGSPPPPLASVPVAAPAVARRPTTRWRGAAPVRSSDATRRREFARPSSARGGRCPRVVASDHMRTLLTSPFVADVRPLTDLIDRRVKALADVAAGGRMSGHR